MVFQYVPSTMSLSGPNGKGRGVWWRGGEGRRRKDWCRRSSLMYETEIRQQRGKTTKVGNAQNGK